MSEKPSARQSSKSQDGDKSSHRDFCQRLLNKHIRAQDEKVVNHSREDVKQLIEAANLALKRDETLVELKEKGNVFIVGDIYGHYKCLWNFLRISEFPPGPTRRFMFLGNYGTRGNRGVESLLLVLLLKITWPEFVFLLRGNHECAQLGVMFGLNKQWEDKFGDGSWTKLCTQVFDWLPLAAVINSRVFVCHGGISRQLTSANSVQAIRRVQRPLDVPQSGLVCDLLWACPQAENGWMEDENKLTQKFGPDVLVDFLASNKLQLLVRGMQCAQNGYLFFPSDRLLTIFSAANWCGDFGNDAAVLHVQTQTEERGVRLQIRTFSIKPEDSSSLMLTDSE